MNVKFKIGLKSKLDTQRKVAGAWYLCKDVGELYYCDGDGENGKFVLVDASNNLKSFTYASGEGLTGSGTVDVNNKSITISHGTKPSSGNDAGGTGALVTGVTIDKFGHVVDTTKGNLEGGATAPDNHFVSAVTVEGKKITVSTKEFPKVASANQADNAATATVANSTKGTLKWTGELTGFDGSTDKTIDIPQPATDLPKGDGTAAIGTSAKWAKSDHVHPSDTKLTDLITNLKAVVIKIAKSYTGTISSNSVSITAATHKCGTNPLVQVTDSSGNVVTCGILIGSNGDITITQNEGLSLKYTIKGEADLNLSTLL